jgi:hypothetical protein
MTKPLPDVFTVAYVNERWLVVAPSERSLAAGRAFDRSVVESGIGPRAYPGEPRTVRQIRADVRTGFEKITRHGRANAPDAPVPA